MNAKSSISKQTRNNWLVDAVLFSSAILAAISGLYFLLIPQGGYRGGRNPLGQMTIIFERHTWSDVHTWVGVIMIAIASVHLVIHWSWVSNMARRTWKEFTGQCGCMNRRGRWNLTLNLVVAVSFLLTAVSGLYFLFFPGGRWAADPMLLAPRSTWNLVHSWSGVILILAAVLHFAIHWRWVVNVTNKIGKSLRPGTGQQPVSAVR